MTVFRQKVREISVVDSSILWCCLELIPFLRHLNCWCYRCVRMTFLEKKCRKKSFRNCEVGLPSKKKRRKRHLLFSDWQTSCWKVKEMLGLRGKQNLVFAFSFSSLEHSRYADRPLLVLGVGGGGAAEDLQAGHQEKNQIKMKAFSGFYWRWVCEQKHGLLFSLICCLLALPCPLFLKTLICAMRATWRTWTRRASGV